MLSGESPCLAYVAVFMLDPTQPSDIDVQKQICHKCPGSQGRPTHGGQRRQRTGTGNCPRDCRDSRTSYPRRNAHRCARRRVSTGPVTERWCTPLAVRQLHESDGMQEAQLTQWHRSQQHLGGTDYTRPAAVRCYRACSPCASPASSSSWAGLRSRLYLRRTRHLVPGVRTFKRWAGHPPWHCQGCQ